MKMITRVLLVVAGVLVLASCSPYASLDIGVPFHLGPVYVNPSIGVGGRL